MKKEIIISEANDLAVVFEDGRAAEFFLRSGDQLVGDIIWGQVEAVVPGIEAAFVNIGQDRNGFIHVADLPSAQTPRKQAAPKRPSIRVRERILVQIAKAPTGSKGARLTGRLTIPGRFLVLVPHDNRVSISRRITETAERDRLRRLTLKLKDPGHGLIVRTEAIGRSEEDLRQDIEELIDIWADILHQVQIVNPPALLHRDSDLIHRVLRDATTGNVAKIVVDTPGGYQKAREIIQGWMPELERHVSLHKGPRPIMQKYRISEELEAAINPKVWLPSGGNLVIEHTEALTVIDVNSSRSTQSRSLADTVLKTNLEAAAEVARQLRLRDIGGIIVIDFISMDAASDRNKVLQAFHEALKQDKSRPQVTNFSEHGLIEVSRRRQGQNLLEQLTQPCEACGGTGRVKVSHLLPQEGAARARFEDDEEAVIEELEGEGYEQELVLADGSEERTEGGDEGGRRRRRRRGRGRGRGRGEEGGELSQAGPEGFETEGEEEELFLEEAPPAPRGGRDRGGRAAAEAAPAARGGRPAPRREETFEEDLEEGSMIEEVSLGFDFGGGEDRGADRGERGGRDRGERGGRDRGGRDRGGRERSFGERQPAGDRGFGRDRGGERSSFGGDRDRGFGGGDRDRGFGGERDRGFGGDRDRGVGGGERDRGGDRGFGRDRGGDRDRGFGRDRGGDRDRGGSYGRDRERVFEDRGPREARPAAALPAEPNAFTVSAPAPRTRRVERKDEGPAPAAAAAPARGTRSTKPVEAAPAPAPAPAKPAAAKPAPAAAAAKPAAEAKPAKAKAEPKKRTAPLPIPEQVEQIGVPGLFVLKKKAAPAAAPAAEEKPAAKKATSTKAKAPKAEPVAEEKPATKARAAAAPRRATAAKAEEPAAEPKAKPAAKSAAAKSAAAKPAAASKATTAKAAKAEPAAKPAAAAKKATTAKAKK